MTVVKIIPVKPKDILNQDGWNIKAQSIIQNQPDIF